MNSDQLVKDLNLNTTYRRHIWADIDRYVAQFLTDYPNQCLIMPGLRGEGETTILTQLYEHPALVNSANVRRFYLSFEKLALTGFSVDDLVSRQDSN